MNCEYNQTSIILHSTILICLIFINNLNFIIDNNLRPLLHLLQLSPVFLFCSYLVPLTYFLLVLSFIYKHFLIFKAQFLLNYDLRIFRHY